MIVKRIFADGLRGSHGNGEPRRGLKGQSELSFLIEHGICISPQDLRFRCPFQFSPVIGEQPAAKLPFQMLNVLRDRRLCHQQKLRRLPVIHCVIQREKGLDAMINHDDALLIRKDYCSI